jgi:hypothetical protein
MYGHINVKLVTTALSKIKLFCHGILRKYCVVALYKYTLCNKYGLIHDRSSIGLTILDAACTVLYSWWWAEEPPETCRAIYRNK